MFTKGLSKIFRRMPFQNKCLTRTEWLFASTALKSRLMEQLLLDAHHLARLPALRSSDERVVVGTSNGFWRRVAPFAK